MSSGHEVSSDLIRAVLALLLIPSTAVWHV